MSAYETFVLVGRRTDGRMHWEHFNAPFDWTVNDVRNKRFNVSIGAPWDEVIEVRVLRRASIGTRIVVDMDKTKPEEVAE